MQGQKKRKRKLRIVRKKVWFEGGKCRGGMGSELSELDRNIRVGGSPLRGGVVSIRGRNPSPLYEEYGLTYYTRLWVDCSKQAFPPLIELYKHLHRYQYCIDGEKKKWHKMMMLNLKNKAKFKPT